MYKPVTAVEVRLWGRRIGAVALDPRLGYYAFEYDPGFVKQGIEVAPLTMPLAQADAPFVFADLPTLTFKRLPALLADALPDDFGNALIETLYFRKPLVVNAYTAYRSDIKPAGVRAVEIREEVTPQTVRIRKKVLSAHLRHRQEGKEAQAA